MATVYPIYGDGALKLLMPCVISIHLVHHLKELIIGEKSTAKAFDIKGAVGSGMLVECKGLHFLVTAAHVVEDIQSLSDSERKIYKSRIVESSDHARTDEGIPFDFVDAPAVVIYNDELGIDVAAVYLSPMYVELLKRGGAQFVTTEWLGETTEAYDCYALLGFPKSSTSVQVTENGSRGTVHFEIGSPMLPIERVEEPPELAKPAERLYFRVLPNSSTIGGKEYSVERVGGMSGGPVWGCKHLGNGKYRFKLIGVQSKQAEVSGILCVCPIRDLLTIIADKLLSQAQLEHD